MAVWTEEKIRERIKELIKEQFNVDDEEVREEATFQEDLGVDSLDIVELIMALEAEFEIEIPDEDVEKIATVGQAAGYIAKRFFLT